MGKKSTAASERWAFSVLKSIRILGMLNENIREAMQIIDHYINKAYNSYKSGNKNICADSRSFKDWFVFDRLLICKLFDEMIKVEDGIDNWDEDFITRSLAIVIRSVLKKDFNVEIWKQVGEDEEKFGDISFVVEFHPSNGNSFVGVSFIEAKRDYQEHNYRFRSFKKNQMEKFLEHTTSSYYLLYSHNSFLPTLETQLLKQYVDAKKIDDRQLKLDDIEVTKITTLPTQLNRFLNGFDLDFSKEMVMVAAGNGKMKPKIIIKADVHGPGFDPTPSPGQTPPFNPNPNAYKKLKNEEKEKKKKENQEITNTWNVSSGPKF